MIIPSWYEKKADDCDRSAEKTSDPSRRSRLKAESRLWRQIARADGRREEALQKSLLASRGVDPRLRLRNESPLSLESQWGLPSAGA
jgi:hypothetical protein